jgi:4-amino-4-deoxy-L-arabinose transferase-like glycosyltransferase
MRPAGRRETLDTWKRQVQQQRMKPTGDRATILPLIVSAAVMAVVWIFHLSLIAEGGINHMDEFYTLDRAWAFISHDDWLTVYKLQVPDFRKPPLQYWMTALLLNGGVDQTTAVRLPSLTFALGALASAGLLAYAIRPQNVWVVPAAILLCASSGEFWAYSLSAMLEAGVAFSVTLALAAVLMALKKPRWWYVVAVAVVFGALQKAPIALALVLVFLTLLFSTARWHGCSLKVVTSNRHFRIAATIGLVGSFGWQLFQVLFHGFAVFREAYENQMVDRFSPFEDGFAARSLFELNGLVIAREPVLRWSGILSLFLLPWLLSRAVLLPLAGVFLVFVLVMLFADGSVYSRYSLMFVPVYGAAIAVVLFSVLRSNLLAALAVVCVSLAVQGPFKKAEDLGLFPSNRQVRQIAVLSGVGAALKEDEALVVCNWDPAARMPTGAISFYAANGRPFTSLNSRGHIPRFFDGERSGAKLRGLCRRAELKELRDRLDGLSVVETHRGYVHWTADAR